MINALELWGWQTERKDDDNKEYYESLKKLHAQKVELQKLKALCSLSKPFHCRLSQKVFLSGPVFISKSSYWFQQRIMEGF